MNTSSLRFAFLAVLLPLALLADVQPVSGTPATSATDAAITAATNATIAKITTTQTAPTPVAVAPAAPQGVVAPAKDAPPAWATTRDAFLAFALDKAKSYTGTAEQIAAKAVDVTVKEAGPTTVEFLHWKLAYHLLRSITPMVFLVICVTLFYKQWPKWELDGYWQEFTTGSLTNFLPTVLGAIGSIVFGGITIANLDDLMSAVQIIVAPRIYMIEQVLHLFGK